MKIRRFFASGVFTGVKTSSTAHEVKFRRILLLSVSALAFTFHSNAQQGEAKTPTLTQIEQDSLVIYHQGIDQLNTVELTRLHESYSHKCRVAPTEMKKRILAYVEEKLKQTR